MNIPEFCQLREGEQVEGPNSKSFVQFVPSSYDGGGDRINLQFTNSWSRIEHGAPDSLVSQLLATCEACPRRTTRLVETSPTPGTLKSVLSQIPFIRNKIKPQYEKTPCNAGAIFKGYMEKYDHQYLGPTLD